MLSISSIANAILYISWFVQLNIFLNWNQCLININQLSTQIYLFFSSYSIFCFIFHQPLSNLECSYSDFTPNSVLSDTNLCLISYKLYRNILKDAVCIRKIRPLQGLNSQCPATKTNALTTEWNNRFTDAVDYNVEIGESYPV